MISYNDPKIELIPEPKGIDLAIQDMQKKIGNITWLQKCFGRCVLQRGTIPGDNGKEENVIYPEVWHRGEPMSLMINDNLYSYCFFHALDPLTFIDYKPLDTLSQLATTPLAIIFWVNLNKINQVKGYNYVDELREEVIRVLKMCPSFIAKTSSVSYDRVFAPFTITKTFQQFLKPPYAAFRIDGDLSFNYLAC